MLHPIYISFKSNKCGKEPIRGGRLFSPQLYNLKYVLAVRIEIIVPDNIFAWKLSPENSAHKNFNIYINQYEGLRFIGLDVKSFQPDKLS